MANKGIAMCRVKLPPAPKEAKPRVRNRCKRDRPRTATELVQAIDSGRLDLRTAPAKRIMDLRAAIADQPVEAARGIIRDVLAVNMAISQAVTAELSKPDFQVLQKDGSLNPLLSGPWAETQKALIGAAKLLIQVETATTAQKSVRNDSGAVSGPVDVSALILEIDNEKDNDSE